MSVKTRLVLDLDQTLVDTKRLEEIKDSTNYDGFFDMESAGLRIHIRPYYSEFISFAEQYFDEIHIFSAGSEDYVKFIASKLFRRDLYKQTLSRIHCFVSSDASVTTKKLDIHGLDTFNTFMIDDRKDVCSGNSNVNIENGNFYQIKAYDVNSENDDNHLLRAIARIKSWALTFTIERSLSIQ